uniref:Uncharacterized protein n=1 Tax=Romanomermis culicivorax TaxID=13658 RepID=A0A915J420_ROMCU
MLSDVVNILRSHNHKDKFKKKKCNFLGEKYDIARKDLSAKRFPHIPVIGEEPPTWKDLEKIDKEELAHTLACYRNAVDTHSVRTYVDLDNGYIPSSRIKRRLAGVVIFVLARQTNCCDDRKEKRHLCAEKNLGTR